MPELRWFGVASAQGSSTLVIEAIASGGEPPPQEVSVAIWGGSIVTATAFVLGADNTPAWAMPMYGRSNVDVIAIGRLAPPPPAAERFVGGAYIQLFRPSSNPDDPTGAWIDVSCEVVTARGVWGSDKEAGVLTVATGGSLEMELYDPDRTLDPSNLLSPVSDLLLPGTRFRLIYKPTPESDTIVPVKEARIDTLTHTFHGSKGRIAGNDVITFLLGTYTIYVPATAAGPSTLHDWAAFILSFIHYGEITIEREPNPPITIGEWRSNILNSSEARGPWTLICDAARDVLYFPWVDAANVLHFRPHAQPTGVPPIKMANDGYWPLDLGLESNAAEIVNSVRAYGSGASLPPQIYHIAAGWNYDQLPPEWSCNIAWTAPPDTGAYPLDKYRLYFRHTAFNGDAVTEFFDYPPTQLEADVTGIVDRSFTYEIWSTAITQFGESADSDHWQLINGVTVVPPYFDYVPPTSGDASDTPVQADDADSIARYGSRQLDRNDRALDRISPTFANWWVDTVLADRKDPSMHYLPIRIWPKNEQDLMALINVEGAQEVLYELDVPEPPISMLTRCIGGNIQVDAEGWAVELLTYINGAAFLQYGREFRRAVALYRRAEHVDA